jgi:hypothetical protein
LCNRLDIRHDKKMVGNATMVVITVCMMGSLQSRVYESPKRRFSKPHSFAQVMTIMTPKAAISTQTILLADVEHFVSILVQSFQIPI